MKRTPGVLVRDAQPKDFDAMEGIDSAAFDGVSLQRWGFSADRARAGHLPTDPWLVVEVHGTVVGFVVGEDAGAGSFTIVSIAVHPEWQGKGLSSHLMEPMLRFVKLIGYCDVGASVLEANAPALHLLTNRGFKVYRTDTTKEGRYVTLELTVPAFDDPKARRAFGRKTTALNG